MSFKSATSGEAMILPWHSFEEYSEWVRPQSVTKSLFRHKTRSSLLQRIDDLRESYDEIEEAIKDLRKLGYDGERGAPESDDPEGGFAPRIAKGVCLHLCHCGEELLVHAKGLAMTHEADDFLHEKDLIDNWDRYNGGPRIHDEINKLFTAALGLNCAYYNIVHNSDDFLLDLFDRDFPDALERDFIIARDQFSVGMEEMGFFSAGRGLEGVLRAVARKKQLVIESSKGACKPAWEEDFNDLIECLSRARWKADKTPLIDGRVKTLLHHLRTSRNATAHHATTPVDENWRALAIVVASHAAKLWKLAQRRYAGLVEKKITRAW